MDAEPAAFGVLLYETVVGQGLPGLVLVDVARRRERGAGGGLVEARGLGEADDPALGMLIVKRFQEALRELAVFAGRHVKRVGLGLDAPVPLRQHRIGAKAQAEGIIRLAVRDRPVARNAQDRLQE